jgi:hypothetical protein
MKKVLFSLSLMFVSAMAFAGNSVDLKPVLDDQCTVTASVNVGGTGVTVSSTSDTCAHAAADVAAGIKAIYNMF